VSEVSTGVAGRLTENTGAVLVHVSVKERLETDGLSQLVFFRPDQDVG
jgi:hypothetical protein